MSIKEIFSLLENTVVVPVIKAIVERILETIEVEKIEEILELEAV
jgi:hypothetical protein